MSWKRRIRGVVDRATKHAGLLAAREERMRGQLTILMYHRVLEDGDCAHYHTPSLVMPKTWFAAQLAYLRAHARVLTVADALAALENGDTADRPLVCLTFDDGYRDNYEVAAPLMRTQGLQGTFYVTVGAVEGQQPPWYDRVAESCAQLGPTEFRARVGGRVDLDGVAGVDQAIERMKVLSNDDRNAVVDRVTDGVIAGGAYAMMTIDQVRALADQGHEVGSHTLTHPILPRMASADRGAEIAGAKRQLEGWLGRDVVGFCYPNGDYDDQVVQEVADAGFRHACTTQAGRNPSRSDPYRLLRLDMTPSRMMGPDGGFDTLGFRSELALLREDVRQAASSLLDRVR